MGLLENIRIRVLEVVLKSKNKTVELDEDMWKMYCTGIQSVMESDSLTSLSERSLASTYFSDSLIERTSYWLYRNITTDDAMRRVSCQRYSHCYRYRYLASSIRQTNKMKPSNLQSIYELSQHHLFIFLQA